MKKIFFLLISAACVVCAVLAGFGAGSSAKPFPDDEDTVLAKEAAARAGINTEKHPAALVTKGALKDGGRVTVIGMLREVGTARFSSLVVTPPANFDIRLNIDRARLSNFEDLYNQYVEVTGIIRVEIAQYGTIEREQYSMLVEKLPRRIQ